MTKVQLQEIRELAAGLTLQARAQQADGRHRESGVTFAAFGAVMALLMEVDPPKTEGEETVAEKE